MLSIFPENHTMFIGYSNVLLLYVCFFLIGLKKSPMIFGLATAMSENKSSSILSFGGIQPESQPGIDGSTDGQTVGLQLEMIEVRIVILKSIFFYL